MDYNTISKALIFNLERSMKMCFLSFKRKYQTTAETYEHTIYCSLKKRKKKKNVKQKNNNETRKLEESKLMICGWKYFTRSQYIRIKRTLIYMRSKF